MKSGKKWGDWSDDELKIALDKTLTARKASDILGRSESAVYDIRKKYQYIPKDRRWNESQERFLMDHPELSDKQLSLILNRSLRGVRDKRYQLRNRLCNKDRELYFTPYDGKTIRKKRNELKIPLHDLASYCGVNPEAIRQAEIGDNKYYKTLRMLATIVLKDFEYEIINWENMEEKN